MDLLTEASESVAIDQVLEAIQSQYIRERINWFLDLKYGAEKTPDTMVVAATSAIAEVLG